MIKKLLYIINSFYRIYFLLKFFGLNTSKFNKNIENKIKENYPSINLNLMMLKYYLNISKLSIDLETANPIILLDKEKIKLGNISNNL